MFNSKNLESTKHAKLFLWEFFYSKKLIIIKKLAILFPESLTNPVALWYLTSG
jgi:hypothetical protein